LNSTIKYIKDFLSRSGGYIFLSTVISRALSFIGSWIALQIIESSELGVILYAYGFIQFSIPLGGLGLHQSLIRFGALASSKQEKEGLLHYVLKKGTIASILLILSIICVSSFIPFQFENTYFYLSILSFSIFSFFILEVVKVQFRLLHKNHLFAKTELWFSITSTVLIYGLSYFLGGMGYIIAIIISPIVTSLLFVNRLNLKQKAQKAIIVDKLSFWKFGFFGGLSNVAGQLLFIIDIILIGYLLNDPKQVTFYRYISLIPFSLLFLPRVIMATDFVTFTEKIKNRNYVQKYINNYLQLFSILSVFIFGLAYFFKTEILSFFGDEYIAFDNSFMILTIGVLGILLFRGIFGNLLSSIGRIEYNYYITSFAIIINIISNYFLIPLYGIKGAAITSAVLMWLTGILSLLCFKYLYKKV